MITHLFNNVDRAKQLVSFAGLVWEKNNRPTDLDGLFEYKNKLYVIVEAKFIGNQMPFGQKLSLTRLCDDLQKVKPTLLILAKHSTPHEQMIDLASADVDEFRFNGRWWLPEHHYTVRRLMDKFINDVMGG